METSYLQISSENWVNNNTYKVNLPNTEDLNDWTVAIGQGYIYYSWYNINSYPLNNNTFTLIVPGMANTTVTIPDGAYNISDLNNYLEYLFRSLGLYTTDSTTGLSTYYASLTVSPTNYKVQWTTTVIPASLPAGSVSGGTNMDNAFTNSNGLKHMQITVASTNNFDDIIGFTAGTYPTLATGNPDTYTHESDFTPNVNPISGVQMRLNCVNNKFSDNNQLLYVFSNGRYSIGEQIDLSPSSLQYVPCMGSHKELTLTFFDQKGRRLDIHDSNIIILLYFKKRL